MTIVNVVAPRPILRVLAALLTACAVIACADKGFSPPTSGVNPKMALQLTTLSSAQQALVAKYIWVGAAAATGKDTSVMASKFVALVTGAQQITLPVDLSTCLAYNATQGKDGCTILVGAALVTDTLSLVADSASGGGDPFKRALDYTILGPFDVAPGHAPTIPAIDLSASRFGVVQWQGDEALRLGGNNMPVSFFGPAPLAGAFSGTGAPVLFALTAGSTYPSTPTPTQPPFYPQLAIFQNGTWQRVPATTAPSNMVFSDETALSAAEVYIAAPGGLYKYDGTTVSRVAAVTDSLLAVASVNNAGGKLVIAAGPNGIVWIGDTQTWKRYVLPASQRLDGACITGANEAYAASSPNGGLFRFDGTVWTVETTLGTANKSGLSCPAPGQVFVMNGPAMLKRSGTSWVTLPNTGLPTGRLLQWGVVSANEIYAYGDSASSARGFYRYDGSVWRSVGQLRFTQPGGKMLADPRGGAAYVASAFGRIEKVTPTSVSVLSYQPGLRDVIVTSATSAFAVGWNLLLARWDGATWTIDAPPANTPTTRYLQGVWSDGPSNAWAVGNSNTVLRYSGSGWSVVSDVNHPIGAVDSYNAVWGVGSDVWIAGENSILHCTSATACANESSGGSGILYGLWGTSRTNVFAVGAGGRIAHYNGTAWAAMPSPTARNLARVAGSGTSDVWALGDSVLVHFDGTQWTSLPLKDGSIVSHVPSQFQGLFQVGLWVRGPKEIYVGSDFGGISRYDGSRWQQMNNSYYLRRVVGISGAGGCALAVTEGQSDEPTPMLWRGVGSSGCFSSPMNPPASWP